MHVLLASASCVPSFSLSVLTSACAGGISKKEPACTCTYYALLCLTGTCKALVRKFSVRLCKPGQGLTVDLQPTYLMTYVPCRKCDLQHTLWHYKNLPDSLQFILKCL